MKFMRLANRRSSALDDPHLASEIQSAKTSFEDGFAEVGSMLMPITLNLSDIVNLPSKPESEPSTKFEHEEIFADGDTFDEALAKWKVRLAICRQTGHRLIWRVAPEFDCWVDFAADKLIWKIYARFFIIP